MKHVTVYKPVFLIILCSTLFLLLEPNHSTRAQTFEKKDGRYIGEINGYQSGDDIIGKYKLIFDIRTLFEEPVCDFRFIWYRKESNLGFISVGPNFQKRPVFLSSLEKYPDLWERFIKIKPGIDLKLKLNIVFYNDNAKNSNDYELAKGFLNIKIDIPGASGETNFNPTPDSPEWDEFLTLNDIRDYTIRDMKDMKTKGQALFKKSTSIEIFGLEITNLKWPGELNAICEEYLRREEKKDKENSEENDKKKNADKGKKDENTEDDFWTTNKTNNDNQKDNFWGNNNNQNDKDFWTSNDKTDKEKGTVNYKPVSKGYGTLIGFKDEKGNIVIDYQFESVKEFTEGFCAVKKNGKWGFINKKGNIIIPCEYDDVEEPFKDGIAKVGKFESKEIKSYSGKNDTFKKTYYLYTYFFINPDNIKLKQQNYYFDKCYQTSGIVLSYEPYGLTSEERRRLEEKRKIKEQENARDEKAFDAQLKEYEGSLISRGYKKGKGCKDN